MKLERLKINEKSEEFLNRVQRSEAYLDNVRLLGRSGQQDAFQVKNGKGYNYVVILSAKSRSAYCSCPDFEKGAVCKHVIACIRVRCRW